jgi:hypothetical protein
LSPAFVIDFAMIDPVQPKPMITMSVGGSLVAIPSLLARYQCCCWNGALNPAMLIGGWG